MSRAHGLWLLLIAACGARSEADTGHVPPHEDAHVRDAAGDARDSQARDAAADADTTPVRDASIDGAGGMHLCYVYDDCNNGRDNDYSATSCPPTPPADGSMCSLDNGQCFYCETGRDAWHWWDAVPQYTCVNGGWSLNAISYACE